MESYRLILPEHLNQYDFLFGGYLLKFVDEVAWIAATLDFPDFNFVTIGVDRVEFQGIVPKGSILRFQCQQAKVGRSSVTYYVEVSIANQSQATESVFSTNVTFVRIDDKGKTMSLRDDNE
ncbi:MAG: acyl-CoA thioesterase [Planctomycetota bacterium]